MILSCNSCGSEDITDGYVCKNCGETDIEEQYYDSDAIVDIPINPLGLSFDGVGTVRKHSRLLKEMQCGKDQLDRLKNKKITKLEERSTEDKRKYFIKEIEKRMADMFGLINSLKGLEK